jgi:hypothetical protein
VVVPKPEYDLSSSEAMSSREQATGRMETFQDAKRRTTFFMAR